MVLTEENLELLRKYNKEFGAKILFSDYSNMFHIVTRAEIKDGNFLTGLSSNFFEDCNTMVEERIFKRS